MRPRIALCVILLAWIVCTNYGLAEEIRCEGALTRIEGNLITVKAGETEHRLKIEPATKILMLGKPGTVMDLKVGQQVKCLGDKRAGDKGDAAAVCTTLEIVRGP